MFISIDYPQTLFLSKSLLEIYIAMRFFFIVIVYFRIRIWEGGLDIVKKRMPLLSWNNGLVKHYWWQLNFPFSLITLFTAIDLNTCHLKPLIFYFHPIRWEFTLWSAWTRLFQEALFPFILFTMLFGVLLFMFLG